jgi:hypothetical protein
MSNTQNKIIFYDPTTENFTHAAHVKFREMFKQNPNPSIEKIQQLSEETGAPLWKCQVCNTNCIDLS